MDIVEKAKMIAAAAHTDQVRKTDSSPYIKHPEAVASILKDYGFSDVVVAAGWVHDVLEDSSVTAEEIRTELGDEVLGIVTAVSEDTSLIWEERKKLYADAVAAASEGARAVSIADKIHNARSLVAYHKEVGPAAWQVFNRGKTKKIWFEEMVYEKVSAVWQHPLLETYRQLVEELKALPD